MKTFICSKHGTETNGSRHCPGTPVEEVYKCECGVYFEYESMLEKHHERCQSDPGTLG